MLRHSALKVEKKIKHEGEVTRARVSNFDDNIVASFMNNGDISLFNIESGEIQSTLKGHSKEGYCFEFSEKHLVSGSIDSTVCVWDKSQFAPETKPLHTLNFHKKEVYDVGFSNNQNMFASVADDSMVAIWDVRTLNAPVQYKKASENGLNAVCFSPVWENTLVTGGQEDGDIHLWDLRMFDSPLSILYGHEKAVSVMEFCPTKPTVLASGAQDNKVSLWDLMKIGEEVPDQEPEEGEEVPDECPALLLQHIGHDYVIEDLAWSKELEYTLFTVDSNMSVHLWKPAAELLRERLYDPNEEVADSFVE